MSRTEPRSPRAGQARELVYTLRDRFVDALRVVAGRDDFERVEWLRDEGRHGGGERLACAGSDAFDRATLNTSIVHYDDDPARPLASATALSCIVHPRHPRAPSIHLHESWTELRGGGGYWRIMADLNPAIPIPEQRRRFDEMLEAAAPDVVEAARAQGDRYFEIPALGRHRGVCHFYLEGHATDDFEADLDLARRVGESTIDCYAELLADGMRAEVAAGDAVAQLAYHTLYLFQVLTLDRGTTSGLLVHDQNDVGILGSLPSRVDRQLLASWEEKLPMPQDALLRAILEVLPDAQPSPVDDATRAGLAAALRAHYRAHPQALALQARGDVLPPSVSNHGAGRAGS